METVSHKGHTIDVVTGASPSGGFEILYIRVWDLVGGRWARVDASSILSFDDEVAAGRHGHELAKCAINKGRV